LKAIVVNPDAPISELPLLTNTERDHIIEAYNDTTIAYPTDRCVHELFEEQAAKRPRAIALACGERTLTYGEFDRRSNQLARYLRSVGAGPEVVVGLCLERSIEMVVGVLGILKSGGVYLPLDPTYPTERLLYVLQDARAKMLITRSALSGIFPSYEGRVISIDTDWNEIAKTPDAPPPSKTCSDNLAHVIYTSGSTGKSKGVMGTHRAVVNRLAWMERFCPHDAEEICCLKTSPMFVDSVAELFGPLTAGAMIRIIATGVERNVVELSQALRSGSVGRIILVPSLLAAMLEVDGGLPTSIRHYICSGEALSSDLVARLAAAGPDTLLLNLYGSTEVMADATAWRSTEAEPAAIGRPIDNVRAFVLDATMNVVATGLPGELYIAGEGLARGYWQRPGLTSERFVPSPFGNGERLYRTGDLVRWRNDGNLEYLGRTDQQVKLRGYRIELGEIETTLRGHESVKDAVVILRENIPGDRRLVAYFIAASEATAVAGELRAYLSRKLPEFMIPSAYVLLDALPLTPNGKIDRRALPVPSDDAVVRAKYVGPSTSIEEVLASIWCKVLDLERVGVDDNFFDLGGHSLLLTQMHFHLVKQIGREFPIAIVFQHPTIRALSAHLSGTGNQEEILLSTERGRRRRRSSKARSPQGWR
jgi:amino acid adenylation domain-containing protein